MGVRVSVQASAKSSVSWAELARSVEVGGFHALYAADHPGVAASPFVALAAAAAVTERIELGTCVANAGVWEPLSLASAVATLDMVSNGRAILGVGAGHTPQEWTTTGRTFPPPSDRVGRMVELIEVTSALLSGGATSYDGEHFCLVGARLEEPRPVQSRIPLLVGGNGDRVLRFAGRHADIAGITGITRTLADGHRHEVDWGPAAARQSIATIRSSAGDRHEGPAIEALVRRWSSPTTQGQPQRS